MNKKTWLASVILFFMVLLVVPTSAEAAWEKDSSGTYRFISTSGKQYSSVWVESAQAGLVKIGNFQYCYQLDGSLYNGWLKVGNNIYYANKKGRILTSKWISSNGNRYYASKTGKLCRNTVVKIGSYYYGFDSNGVMQRGKSTIKSKTYYFYKKNGRMVRKAFVTIGGNKYYFGSTGVLGKSVWVKNYYVNTDGYVATNTWVGSRYVGADGHPLKGLQEIGGVYYYFDTSTGKKITSTTKKINGVTYTFAANGIAEAQSTSSAAKPSVSVQSTYYSDPVVSDEVLLSAIIYCEAGNQPYYGQLGVGLVITNRMRSSLFPSKLKEVVYQTVQFSPTFDGTLTRVLKNQSLITSSCKKAAKEVMSKYKAGNYSVTVNGKSVSLKSYLFFMTKAAYVRLKLASPYTQLEGHVFFQTWKRA